MQITPTTTADTPELKPLAFWLFTPELTPDLQKARRQVQKVFTDSLPNDTGLEAAYLLSLAVPQDVAVNQARLSIFMTCADNAREFIMHQERTRAVEFVYGMLGETVEQAALEDLAQAIEAPGRA